MKPAKTEQQLFRESQHKRFILANIDPRSLPIITGWVEDNLMKNSEVTILDKMSFFEAESSLLTDLINSSDFKGVLALLEAIDAPRFERDYGMSNNNFKQHKVNQCSVLARAIIDAEQHVATDVPTRKGLGRLLHAKYKRQKDAGNQFFKPEIDAKVETAFRIVQFDPSQE